MPNAIALLISFSLSAAASLPDFKTRMVNAVDVRSGKKIMAKGSSVKAILFMGFLDGCPLFAKYQNTLKQLKQEFGDRLLVVNFDPDVGARQNLKKSLRALNKLGNNFPLVLDPEGLLNAKLGILTASEVALVSVADSELIYRGSIDDRLTLDFERPEAKLNYAHRAIERVLSGVSGPMAFTTASGCALNLKPSTP